MAKLKRLSHEMFAREYVTNGGNAKEAYLKVWEVYPKKTAILPDSYKVIGCLIKQRPEVRRRIEELRDRMAKRADITEDKILSDYQEALNIARMQARPGDMVNAATAQAKLVGLLRERFEHGDVGDFDNMDNISDILTAVKERAGAEAALALAKAFGLGNADTANVEPPQEEATGLIDQSPPSDAVN